MIKGDESAAYYTISDHADLTLPDSEWCYGVWLKVDDNSGSLYQYFLSNDTAAATNSINCYLNETSDQVTMTLDSNTAQDSLTTTTTYGADGLLRLWVFQRNASDEWQIITCVAGAAAVDEGTLAVKVGMTTINSANDLNILRRQDANVDRYYGETLGHLFKGNFSLSVDEVTAIASGVPPWILGKTLQMYVPFRQNDSTCRDIIGSHHATKNGSPTTETIEPPLDWGRVISMPVAVASGNAPTGNINGCLTGCFGGVI